MLVVGPAQRTAFHLQLDVSLEEASYLERHSISVVLKALLKSLLRDRPVEPVGYLASQLDPSLPALPLSRSPRSRPATAPSAHVQGIGGQPAAQRGEERDTDESLDVDPWKLLAFADIPKPGCFHSTAATAYSDLSRRPDWRGEINVTFLESWELQPSPCCAAAAVAGAFNTLFGLKRGNEERVSFREVADIMAHQQAAYSAKRDRKLEGLLGLAEGSVKKVFHAVDEELRDRGGITGVTPEDAFDALCSMLQRRVLPSVEDAAALDLKSPPLPPMPKGVKSDGKRGFTPTPSTPRAPQRPPGVSMLRGCAFTALKEALGLTDAAPEGRPASSRPASARRPAKVPRKKTPAPEGGGRGRTSSSDTTASTRSTSCGSKSSAGKGRSRSSSPAATPRKLVSLDASPYAQSPASEAACAPALDAVKPPRPPNLSIVNWQQEVREALSKHRGVLLLRLERPKTSAVGSPGVRSAADAVAISRGKGCVKTRTFLSSSTTSERSSHTVGAADCYSAVLQQWALLKEAVSRPGSVLIFHLRNHYAPVYAWREWLEEDSEVGLPVLRRQILTARRGQRPSAWLDFEEVRSTILSWTGYNLIQIWRSDMAPPILDSPRLATPSGGSNKEAGHEAIAGAPMSRNPSPIDFF
eukprot:TRINITY_DN43103_c0_g2_i1.p1 TRINITY_DN43103_c0_g2~~TRINITY_DN43103_c0_g2_i1.p1  ORF type:complete len:641 (+),score=107.54 TRINITY_DN43103_c0_g2_i1:90-2012(+)